MRNGLNLVPLRRVARRWNASAGGKRQAAHGNSQCHGSCWKEVGTTYGHVHLGAPTRWTRHMICGWEAPRAGRILGRRSEVTRKLLGSFRCKRQRQRVGRLEWQRAGCCNGGADLTARLDGCGSFRDRRSGERLAGVHGRGVDRGGGNGHLRRSLYRGLGQHGVIGFGQSRQRARRPLRRNARRRRAVLDLLTQRRQPLHA
mmetsp:Transcript_69090/g.154122  ORF Transcript_69090/g.154122 Transcript_69090/m.154122 type:complete len:201 (-) Transcript_69090:639-1241(-)